MIGSSEAGKAGRQDAVGRVDGAAEDGVGQGVAVDGVGQRLAHLDVVEGFLDVVEGHVAGVEGGGGLKSGLDSTSGTRAAGIGSWELPRMSTWPVR